MESTEAVSIWKNFGHGTSLKVQPCAFVQASSRPARDNPSAGLEAFSTYSNHTRAPNRAKIARRATAKAEVSAHGDAGADSESEHVRDGAK